MIFRLIRRGRQPGLPSDCKPARPLCPPSACRPARPPLDFLTDMTTFPCRVQDGTIGEGSHFRIPLVTYPTIFDVRLKPRVVASRTGTKDLQQVQISLRVLSRPNVDKLPEIYRTLGEDFDERVLPSIVNEGAWRAGCPSPRARHPRPRCPRLRDSPQGHRGPV